LKKVKFMNSKGISVLFLVIAMLLMVTIGYVFSYLMPSKQKSIIFPIQSTQGFFLAQSGVEFAVRYAQDQGWTTTASLNSLNGMTRNLGSGRFTLTYIYGTYGDTLISIGEVPIGTERRRITVSNFTSFLQTQALIIDPGSPAPCWTLTNQRVRFYIKNVGTSDITLNAFFATWSASGNTRLRWIFFNGFPSYWGNYSNGDPADNFNIWNPTIHVGDVFYVDVFWQHARVAGNIDITFYDTAGVSYTFNLDPTGSC